MNDTTKDSVYVIIFGLLAIMVLKYLTGCAVVQTLGDVTDCVVHSAQCN